MTHTRAVVVAAVGAAFAEADRDAVLAALDRYGVEPHERERERVQLAIIEISAGHTDRLQAYVQSAKHDYRDVLAWKQAGPLTESVGHQMQDEARSLIERWGKK